MRHLVEEPVALLIDWKPLLIMQSKPANRSEYCFTSCPLNGPSTGASLCIQIALGDSLLPSCCLADSNETAVDCERVARDPGGVVRCGEGHGAGDEF
jgi:hypothetical protein